MPGLALSWAGDTARALKAMDVHLSLIETRLTPRASPQSEGSPELELRRAWKVARKQM